MGLDPFLAKAAKMQIVCDHGHFGTQTAHPCGIDPEQL